MCVYILEQSHHLLSRVCDVAAHAGCSLKKKHCIVFNHVDDVEWLQANSTITSRTLYSRLRPCSITVTSLFVQQGALLFIHYGHPVCPLWKHNELAGLMPPLANGLSVHVNLLMTCKSTPHSLFAFKQTFSRTDRGLTTTNTCASRPTNLHKHASDASV